MSERYYPDAEKIIVVADNLNTHTKAAFYEAFQPCIAYALAQKFEFHYTPKHGSWLNMAEIEINVLVNHGLKKRVPTINEMKKQVTAWYKERNKTEKKINWRFSTDDARIKLKRLYPQLQ